MKRFLLVLLAIVVALPIAAFAAVHFLLNGDMARAQIANAVRRATGRELTIAGPITLGWSLTPTIVARDVSLLNPPGMSRPATAHVDRVEADVAILPLLERRVEVRRLVLAQPDILLERDAQGRPNWLPIRPEALPTAPATAAPSQAKRFQLAIGEIEIRDAHVLWRGGGPVIDATASRIVQDAEAGRVEGQLAINGVPLTLSGTAGPIAAGSWPLHLQLVGGGLSASVTGTSEQAALLVLAPDLAAVAPLAGRSLPAIHEVKLTATLSGAGVSGVDLQAGASDLAPGLQLVRLHASAPSLKEPVTSTAEIRYRDLPVAVALNLGSLQALLGRGPIPFQAQAATGDAVLSGQGTLADLRGTGLDATISARAADLRRLGDLAGVAVPKLQDVALDVHVAPTPGRVLLRGLRFTSGQGDISGDLAIGLEPRPSLRGSLVSQRLALDGWAVAAPPPAPAPAQAAAPTVPASPPPVSDRVIPDRPVPFAALRGADADVHLAIGEAVWRGASYRAVDARLLLDDGRLRLAPLSAHVPGGVAFAQIMADAAAQQVSVIARAPGLAAGPTLALLGAPEDTTKGTLDLDLQLRGEGSTLRALAATLEGHVGLAIVDGEIENRWLEQLFAETLRAASLPVETSGISRVRCAAIRADANAGQVQLRTLVLDTTRLKLEGSGTLDLGRETLDLHLKPQLRLGTALSVPVRVSGSFRAPKIALDAGAIAPGRVGITIGRPAAADTCGPALALARDGQPGPAPVTPEPPTRPTRPADLLRGLIR